MLLQNHELRGSFVPPREIRELRELLRGRVHLLEEVNRVKNRSEQLCQSGNIKLSSVATDIFGISGRQMLEALIENQRDPSWIADYARTSLRGKKAQLELALEGTFTDHQRWMLKEHLRHLEWLEGEVAMVQGEVRNRMTAYASQVARLNTIPGIDELTAWTIIAEIGPDGSAFRDAKHVASWAGLCPGNHESAGKKMSGRTTHGNRYLKRALCQAAWAATRAKGTYPAALYRRIRSRNGHQSAIIAVAHYLLVVSYQLLRKGGEYVEVGADYYDQKNKPKVVRRLVQRLNRLGYYADLRPVGAEAPYEGSVSGEVYLSKVAEPKGFPAG
jgi:transposase